MINIDLAVGFSAVELCASFGRLKSVMAPNLDCMPAEMPKYVNMFILEIYDLYSSYLQQGVFPLSWKMAELCALLKDPSLNPRNKRSIRPISLLACKWLEDLIMSRLQVDLEMKSMVDKRQYGLIVINII